MKTKFINLPEESKRKILEASKRGVITQQLQKEKRREEYKKNPTLCLFCQQGLPFEKKRQSFCNHSCAVKFSNQKKQILLKLSQCLHCNKNIETKNADKYCSRECYFKFNQNLRDAKILAGGKVYSSTLRNFLKRTLGSACSKCKLTEWNDLPIPLELEHIDGNSENHSLDNVCLLCPNCHAQTPTYKGKNIGNGRHKRRERFRQGKSY